MGYVSTWMANHLISTPDVGCVWIGISLCHQTFVNSSALLISVMALPSHKGPKHLLALLKQNFIIHRMMYLALIVQNKDQGSY